tara:strand:- start:425 stop:829 length:405 start_codon:yes stop_codon:yes gene_type:complete
MKIWVRRLLTYSCFLGVIGLGVYLILSAFNDNVMYYLTPADLLDRYSEKDLSRARLGGYVLKGSIKRQSNHNVSFILNHNSKNIHVEFNGFIPTLFKEGKMAVVIGRWSSHQKKFYASSILAKHDENYKPPTKR